MTNVCQEIYTDFEEQEHLSANTKSRIALAIGGLSTEEGIHILISNSIRVQLYFDLKTDPVDEDKSVQLIYELVRTHDRYEDNIFATNVLMEEESYFDPTETDNVFYDELISTCRELHDTLLFDAGVDESTRRGILDDKWELKIDLDESENSVLTL